MSSVSKKQKRDIELFIVDISIAIESEINEYTKLDDLKIVEYLKSLNLEMGR